MTMSIPTNASELREMLSDTKKVAELSNDGKLGEVIDSYVAVSAKKDRDIAAQVDEQVQNGILKFMRENGQDESKARVSNAGASNKFYNAAAVGAKLDKDFNGVHDYFNVIHHNAYQSPELQARREKIENAYSSHDGASGGFLVPEEIRSNLLSLSLESGVVRPRATTVPMSTPRVSLPIVDSTSNVSSVYGGLSASWLSEKASPSSVSPTFGRVTLDAYTLEVYAEIPNQLLRDATAFEAFVNKAFPEALAFWEDYAFMHGTGVGQPEGFYNSDAGVLVAKRSGQNADTIVWQNIVDMYSRMLPASINKAVWVVAPDAFPELATMALAVGTGGSAIWLTDGTGAPQLTLLGRPVVVSEKAPKLGDEGDVTFVDLSFYNIGDHQTMEAESSPHYKFQTSETAFKVSERVDGKILLQSAITPNNGGATLSPVVKLAERA